MNVIVNGGPDKTGRSEKQIHHYYLLTSNNSIADAWTHIVSGIGTDHGARYISRWLDIVREAADKLINGTDGLFPLLLEKVGK